MNKYLTTIGMWVAVGAVVASFAVGGYLMWKKSIEAAALLKFNTAQLEQIARDAERLAAQTEKIALTVKQLNEDMEKSRLELEAQLTGIEDFLNSPEVVDEERGGGLSSPVLRETVRRLGRQ